MKNLYNVYDRVYPKLRDDNDRTCFLEAIMIELLDDAITNTPSQYNPLNPIFNQVSSLGIFNYELLRSLKEVDKFKHAAINTGALQILNRFYTCIGVKPLNWETDVTNSIVNAYKISIEVYDMKTDRSVFKTAVDTTDNMITDIMEFYEKLMLFGPLNRKHCVYIKYISKDSCANAEFKGIEFKAIIKTYLDGYKNINELFNNWVGSHYLYNLNKEAFNLLSLSRFHLNYLNKEGENVRIPLTDESLHSITREWIDINGSVTKDVIEFTKDSDYRYLDILNTLKRHLSIIGKMNVDTLIKTNVFFEKRDNSDEANNKVISFSLSGFDFYGTYARILSFYENLEISTSGDGYLPIYTKDTKE